MDIFISAIFESVDQFFGGPNPMRSVLIFILSLIFAYFVSNLVARAIVKLAQFISVRADNAPNDEKLIQLRRVETFLSVTIAVVRVVVVAVVAYLVWDALTVDENRNASAAAIGASAIFIVLAGGTINPLLRDITAGATMIIERWFTVGDYIRVEPFMDMGGVVERVTLRSTKMRSLNGEVIWMHNQHIQGVRVTPRGVRTIAVDIFVTDRDRGEQLVKKIMKSIPIGPMTVAQPLSVVKIDQWDEQLWLITIVGQTPPGREWLIENFFVESIKEQDKAQGEENRVILHAPIVRFADPAAERSFKRAVRVTRRTDG